MKDVDRSTRLISSSIPEQLQRVWFSNPKELEEHLISRKPFIVVVAVAKEPGKTPATFRKFEKVVVVQSTGVKLSNRSIETKILRRVTSNPSILPRDFDTRDAIAGLKRLGYKNIVSIDADIAEQYEEGQRLSREATVLSRNSKLVKKAKAHFGTTCMACGFDFGKTYGSIGEGYIECHHLNPLAGRAERTTPTKLTDVVVLCSNCHRMVHRQKNPLTVDELMAAMVAAATPISATRSVQQWRRAANKQRPGRKNAVSGRSEDTRPISRLSTVRSRSTS